MRPDQIDLLHAAGRPSLTPNGRVAVIAIGHPDLDGDRMDSGLWAVATDGTGPTWQLTNGPGDSAPAVSPDGQRVAFLRGAPGKGAQLHLTGVYGGEPIALTDHPLGAGTPRWSPDGTQIAYGARVPEPGRYGTEGADERTPSADAEAPRSITTFRYRIDDVGFIRDRREHLFVIDVPPAATAATDDPPDLPLEARQLTAGDHDDSDPVWSPDSRVLAFASQRHATRETDLRSGVHLVAADRTEPTGHPMAVTDGTLSVDGLAWLPDGRLLVSATDLGPTGRDFVGRQTQLHVTEAAVDTAAAAVPAGEGVEGPAAALRALTDATSLDLVGGSDGLVVTGGRVVVQDQRRGAVRLLSIDPDGALVTDADAEVVLDGAIEVRAHAASRTGSVLAVSVATPDRAGDVGIVEDGEVRMLTDLSAPLREAGGVRPLIEVEATGEDGHPVHGWVVLPDPAVHGDGPHPVLLTIHGGPHAQYGWGLLDEAQVHARAGRAVLMCNPRGSAGYGEAHGRAVRGALGTVDAEDVLTFLDHALGLADLPLDAARVGVQGGSYGGYMTGLLTTRTDRFTAAVVERGYLDPESFVGSSDIGWFFPGEYHGDDEAMAAQNPMRSVDRVTTPTLVIHSEQDWRCPVEQGQRWYVALRRQDVDAELLLFPGEGHELSRSGRPRHRQQRFEHILQWWDRHLPVG